MFRGADLNGLLVFDLHSGSKIVHIEPEKSGGIWHCKWKGSDKLEFSESYCKVSEVYNDLSEFTIATGHTRLIRTMHSGQPYNPPPFEPSDYYLRAQQAASVLKSLNVAPPSSFWSLGDALGVDYGTATGAVSDDGSLIAVVSEVIGRSRQWHEITIVRNGQKLGAIPIEPSARISRLAFASSRLLVAKRAGVRSQVEVWNTQRLYRTGTLVGDTIVEVGAHREGDLVQAVRPESASVLGAVAVAGWQRPVPAAVPDAVTPKPIRRGIP